MTLHGIMIGRPTRLDNRLGRRLIRGPKCWSNHPRYGGHPMPCVIPNQTLIGSAPRWNHRDCWRMVLSSSSEWLSFFHGNNCLERLLPASRRNIQRALVRYLISTKSSNRVRILSAGKPRCRTPCHIHRAGRFDIWLAALH